MNGFRRVIEVIEGRGNVPAAVIYKGILVGVNEKMSKLVGIPIGKMRYRDPFANLPRYERDRIRSKVRNRDEKPFHISYNSPYFGERVKSTISLKCFKRGEKEFILWETHFYCRFKNVIKPPLIVEPRHREAIPFTS